MLTAPRMYFAMARDGVFFKRLAIVHPTLGTPAFAIIAIAIWSAVLASTGTFEQLLTYVVFTGWIFYGLGALSVFVYRRREPEAPRPFRVPGYPIDARALRRIRGCTRAEHAHHAAHPRRRGSHRRSDRHSGVLCVACRLASPSAFSSNCTGALMMHKRCRESMIIVAAAAFVAACGHTTPLERGSEPCGAIGVRCDHRERTRGGRKRQCVVLW